ncbi:MAG: hypothetical protein ACI4JZ_01850 [Oscillospiraceae bacterium]
MKKQISAIISAILVLASLTGCSNTTETSGESGSESGFVNSVYVQGDPTARFPRQEMIDAGELDLNAPRLDLAAAKDIIARNDDIKAIITEFDKVHKCPDYAGGSGMTTLIYNLDENDGIYVLYEQSEIFHQTFNPDGTLKSSEQLF